MAQTDILVKDLYIENACLTANLKRLQQHYNMITGLNTESTSIWYCNQLLITYNRKSFINKILVLMLLIF